jgi:hypothetical protein
MQADSNAAMKSRNLIGMHGGSVAGYLGFEGGIPHLDVLPHQRV